MWGRITQIAEKLDDTFGTDEGVAAAAEDSPSGDGWDEGDDFNDEDLEFDEAELEWGGGSNSESVNNEDESDNNDDVNKSERGEGALENEGSAVESPVENGVGVASVHPVENGEPRNFEMNGHDSAAGEARAQDPTVAVDEDRVVTVSAPGKALIAGGYLVLESPNIGVVIGSKGCKFHCTVAFRPTYEGAPADMNGDKACIPVDVYSPQFDSVFTYMLSYSSDKENNFNIQLGLRNDESNQVNRNKFIERTLLLCFGYLRSSLGEQFQLLLETRQPNTSLAIKLRADNDFYSQLARFKEMGLEPTPQNVHKLEPFLCPIDKAAGSTAVNKTGLGSSAALVTSLVGGLLQFFGVISLPSGHDVTTKEKPDDSDGLRISHNLAQICHCYAQGKIGSGFDVSSAVYGSHIYTRFSKSVINSFVEGVESLNSGSDSLQLSDKASKDLLDLVNDTTNKWDCTVTPFTLPKGLEIIMADVCGGSESPSMAKKVLDWKNNNRKIGFMEDYYWKDLKRCNKKIASLLTKEFASAPVVDGLQRDGANIIANRTAEQWKKPMPSSWHEFEGSSWYVAGKLLDLRMAFIESRQNLKGMGKAAGVPIEPDEQTKLANATMKLPGVIAAGVPGAGGYDALFVLYVRGPETADGLSDKTRDDIGNLWREMSEADDKTVICPLTVRAAGFGGEDGLCVSKLDWLS